MSKIFFLIGTLSLIIMTNLIGQSRDISGVFEDVTLVDINGSEHRPYEYLEAGKIVIIDIFATWSGPCWNYHETGHLQNIYETYGPDGTDEVMVFVVEGDLNTTTYDIFGTGNNTLGNYDACAPYPIIDDHEFPFNIGFSNFPTLLFICPDKQVQEIGQLTSNELVEMIQSECPAPQHSNNLDLLYYTSDQIPFCITEEYIPKVLVQNNGTNTISHVSLSYEVDEQVLVDSIGFDIFLNPYETVELPFPAATIERETDFDITVLTVNQVPDNYYTDQNSLRATKPHYSTESYELELQIETDNFGYETFWFITDDSGFYVASGGNDLVIPGGQQDISTLTQGDYYGNNDTIHEFITLQDGGCYTFNIFDDWGDGLCCPYGAGFRILDLYGTELIKNERFLDQHFVSFEFRSITIGTEQIGMPTINAYPIPTTDLINIDFATNFNGKANFSIFNTQGIETHQFDVEVSSGENHFELNTQDLPNGTYFINALLDQQHINIPFQIFR